MTTDSEALPDRLSAPARRALAGAGVTRLVDLTDMTEDEVAALHGIGPSALDSLRTALRATGMTFATPAMGEPPDGRPRMFDEDLSGLTADERDALKAVIDHVAAVAPDAVAGRSYGLPAFRYHGKPLLGFAAAKGHLSLYPFSPQVLEAVAPQLDGYELSKGTLRFTEDRPVPAQVVTEMVRRRMAEIDGT